MLVANHCDHFAGDQRTIGLIYVEKGVPRGAGMRIGEHRQPLRVEVDAIVLVLHPDVYLDNILRLGPAGGQHAPDVFKHQLALAGGVGSELARGRILAVNSSRHQERTNARSIRNGMGVFEARNLDAAAFAHVSIHAPVQARMNHHSEIRMRSMDTLKIAEREFRSRLFIGTGKYRGFPEMKQCHEASGAEVVTVAVRRVNLSDRSKESLLDYIDTSKYFILPNTAACFTADDAIRTARLGREAGLSNWVKLEVIGDEKTLFPDNAGLLEATRVLTKEGFVVLPYTNDDLVNARKLIDAGAAAVMPLAAPIGSGLGIQNVANLRILRELIHEVPLILDAGVGAASDVAIAMELGYDGVLLNTAVAAAQDSVAMATAMKLAVEAGRYSYLAGRMPKKLYAAASSPITGVVGSAA